MIRFCYDQMAAILLLQSNLLVMKTNLVVLRLNMPFHPSSKMQNSRKN